MGRGLCAFFRYSRADDLAYIELNVYAKPFFPAGEGLCGVIAYVGRFFPVVDAMGRKLLIHFIQFYSAAGLVAAPE